jgi:hypothetical protein
LKTLTHVSNSSWLTGVWVGENIKMAAIFAKNADSRCELLVVDRCLGELQYKNAGYFAKNADSRGELLMVDRCLGV